MQIQMPHNLNEVSYIDLLRAFDMLTALLDAATDIEKRNEIIFSLEFVRQELDRRTDDAIQQT